MAILDHPAARGTGRLPPKRATAERTESRDLKQTMAGARWVVVAVGALTVLGLALRLARYEQSVFGDEMSTLYIVEGRSLSEVMSYVSGDAEISPPLFFILAWLATNLGSAPELVRLPSLVAGTISIPLVYLIGARAVNRPAGLIAAGVMALTPFMIFYSADGRGYAVTIALLVGSTLAMLEGARTGRGGWWVAYGAFSVLAMYTHYTAVFPLSGQLLWLLWAYPQSRRPALIANAAAAVLYLPWLPDLADDFDSPTTDILYAIQGAGIAAKLRSIGSWMVGYPYTSLSDFLGLIPVVLGAVGFVAAAAAGLYRHLRARASARSDRSRPPLVSPGMALVLTLAISSGAFALLFLITTGNDLLSPRTLVASSAGLALLIGAVLASAGRLWGSICTVLVAACFAYGAAQTLATENELPDFKSAAAFIDSEADPDDVIVDVITTTGMTPVPLTPLDAYLERSRPEYRIGLPAGEPPLLLMPPVPAPALLRQAVREARGGSLIVVGGDGSLIRDADQVTGILEGPSSSATFELPPGSKLIAERRFPGSAAVNVDIVQIPRESTAQR